LGKSTYKVEGGKMIKVNLCGKFGKIEKVKIMGDFFLHPEELIEDLERILIGIPLDETKIRNSIQVFLETNKGTFIGAKPEDFAKCIMMAGIQDE
jgi:lipoate-protein ligase A